MVYILYLVAVVNFLLSVIVFANNPRHAQNRYFSMFAFFGSFWSLGAAFLLYAQNQQFMYLGQYLFITAPLWTAYFIVLFALTFPNNKKPTLSLRLLLSIYPAILSVIYIFSSSFFISSALRKPVNSLDATPLGYSLYALFFFIYLGVAPGILLKTYNNRQLDSTLRLQIIHSTVAISLTSFVSAFTNLIAPVLGNASLIWAGPLTGLAFVVLISRAVIRYKLFDIRLVVARSLAYVLLLASLVGIYGLLVFGLADLVFGGSELSQRVVPILTAILLAFTTPALRRLFNRLTNKIFYRDAYDAQIFLDEFNKVLVSTIDIDDLLKGAIDVIDNYLKPTFVAFLLKETNSTKNRIIDNTRAEFKDEDIAKIRHLVSASGQKVVVTDELEVPNGDFYQVLNRNDIGAVAQLGNNVSSHKEAVGYLLLGMKKSGNIYNRQDIRMLEIVANELVIAIQNALRFEEIENFNITLQEKVDDATRRLRQTNEKLRQLDETKDEFISMASHQLRTPLTSMKGYVSMVLEEDAGKITKMQRKLLDQAFVSSQRMVYLIADLLNVSRLKTGKFVIEAIPTNLADVVEGEISQLEETAKSRGLELVYEKPADFPALMLDETKIRQVVMNFIDNAIYYTPSGGHITVTLEDKGNTVEYKVTDDGIGVPKHEQHFLFSKFFRAGNAKKARPDGTGLGLFMAKKVIVAQGGSLIFNSQEGKGSTFGFSFPKAKLTHSLPATKKAEKATVA